MGVALNVTLDPAVKSALHVVLQEMPDGEDPTEPEPTTLTPKGYDVPTLLGCSEAPGADDPPHAASQISGR